VNVANVATSSRQTPSAAAMSPDRSSALNQPSAATLSVVAASHTVRSAASTAAAAAEPDDTGSQQTPHFQLATFQSLKAPADGNQDALLDFAVTLGLSQIVQAPARGDNLLDVILTNEPLSVCNFDVFEPFSTSDHCQVKFSVFSDSNHSEERVNKRYDWSNADYDGMSDYTAGIR